MNRRQCLAAWKAVIFEHDAVRTPGAIQLGLPQRREDGTVVAPLSFHGALVAPVTGAGATDLEALEDALRLGSEALDAFRASGGQVLHDTHGFGMQPDLTPLEKQFRIVLRQRFGLVEESLDAAIVAGPTPDASGQVLFKVRVGQRLVRVVAVPDGIGVDGEGGQRADEGKAISAVSRFLKEHRAEEMAWHREAARLRREAGNPPPLGGRSSRDVAVLGEPRAYERSVVFRTRGPTAELRVVVSQTGSVIDDCDDWRGVTDDDRQSAISAVLEHIFAHPEQAAALGIDLALLEELHR
jgi:hypothetical protein